MKPLYVLQNHGGEFFAAWIQPERKLITTPRRTEAKPMHYEIAEAYAEFFQRENLGSFGVDPFRQSQAAGV
jgi:hypothetical protein